MSRGRRILFILGAIFCAVLVSVALLEIGLRIFNPLGLKERASWHFLLWSGLQRSPNPEKVWEPVPNYREQLVGYRVSINPLGLRGDDVAEPKGAGVYRILALGDSMTFGMSADQKDTFPAQLEELLRTKDTKRATEVLNGGVLGYTTLQEEALLRELLPQVQADLVVVWWFHNDVVLTGAANPSTQDEALRYQIGLKPHSIGRKILHAAYVVLPCTVALIRAATVGRNDGIDSRFVPAPDLQPGGLKANLASLQRIIDLCKANTTKVIIYSYGQYAFLEELCEKAGVPYATTVESPGTENVKEYAISRRDPHFSRAGNRRVAETVLKAVESTW